MLGVKPLLKGCLLGEAPVAEDLGSEFVRQAREASEKRIRRRRPLAGDQPPEAEGRFLLSTAERQPGTFASHAGEELLDSLERLVISIPRRVEMRVVPL